MYFDSRDTFCKQPFGAVETGKRVTLRLKLDKEPAPKNVRLFMYCVHTGSGEYRKMKLCGETQTENIYSVSFWRQNQHFTVTGLNTKAMEKKNISDAGENQKLLYMNRQIFGN